MGCYNAIVQSADSDDGADITDEACIEDPILSLGLAEDGSLYIIGTLIDDDYEITPDVIYQILDWTSYYGEEEMVSRATGAIVCSPSGTNNVATINATEKLD